MNAPIAPPLLRSPPFPGVPDDVAAVSGWAAERLQIPYDSVRVDKLILLISHAGVAGAFWERDADATVSDLGQFRENPRVAHRDLIEGVSYRNPFTGAVATPEQTVALLSFWRGEIMRNPGYGRHLVVGAGIAGWKRSQVRQLLWAGHDEKMAFRQPTRSDLLQIKADGGAVVAWPSRIAAVLPQDCEELGIPFYRVEDGFIRSVGLGADCHPPFSIVVDKSGAHYDPTKPSDLETLLANAEFSTEQLERAQTLIALIISSRVSKYGTGTETILPPRTRRRVLVTGQVEDDVSVLLGGDGLTSNLELLRRARSIEPAAEIWFKPHPDVDAGHRKGRVKDDDILRHADRIVRGVPIADLFDAIDAIHVLTSLAGFEALLRGVEVMTHGIPFYAGWGLTHDLGKVPDRRQRTLTLEELVAGVLLTYPRYLDPETNLPCTAEILIHRLSAQKKPQETWLTRIRHLQGRIRRMASELRA